MEPSGKGFRDSNTWGVICSSHSRKTLKRWEQVRSYVEEKGVEFEFVLSDGKDSVERTSKEFCERGCKTLVVIGSDGTLNDVINGVMSAEHLPDGFALGMIPSGIGNDFASFWDIPVDSFKHAVDNILARRLKRIDIGVCKYEDENHLSQVRYFLNCVNIGLGARLIQLTNRYQGLIPSKKLSLIPIFIGQIFSRKSFNIAFKADTEKLKAMRARTEQESKKVDSKLLEKYHNIKQHCTPPMAKLINGQCSGCFMSLPSATLLDIRSGDRIVECDNCGRILYDAGE